MEITVGLWGMQPWLAGDFAGITRMVMSADEKGIDRFDIPDHLLMSENVEAYPYAQVPPAAIRAKFYEPLTMLAAVGAVTNRIRLSTGILIAPLRSAALLAKQAATLDVISGGRLDLGIGVGWQKEEYDASLVPWDGRFGHMDEQIRVCKEFWRNAPASFHGDRINFDRLYSLPFPVQAGGIPIWFGVAPTERNFARIAELGDGWMPSPKEDQPAKLKEHIDALRAAFLARGRHPGSVKVQAKPRILRKPDGTPDIDTTLAQYSAFAEAGATAIYVAVHNMCQSPQDYDSILDRLIAVKAGL